MRGDIRSGPTVLEPSQESQNGRAASREFAPTWIEWDGQATTAPHVRQDHRSIIDTEHPSGQRSADRTRAPVLAVSHSTSVTLTRRQKALRSASWVPCVSDSGDRHLPRDSMPRRCSA